MDNFDKIGSHGISSSLKGKLALPILQSGLIVAGGVTQVITGKIPRKSSIGETAESYLKKSNFEVDISEESKKMIENFRGIILATHNNGNFSDFPALLSLMSDETLNRLIIGAGKSVTRMYQLLFPNIKVCCVEPHKTILSEVSTRDIVQNAKEISESVDKGGVALLPYNPEVGEMQGVHRQVIKGVEYDTPILEISTEFPEKISYTNGLTFGQNSVYGRILGNPPPMTIKISAEPKNKMQLGNR